MLTGTAAVLAVLLGACGGSDSGPETQPLNDDLRVVLSQVVAVRKTPPPAGIEVGSVPRDEVAELLREQLTDADRESFEDLTTLYRLLGLVGAEDDYEQLYLDFAAGALIGFFEPADNKLWLVDAPEALDFDSFDATLRSTVAHEFVHALQDKQVDLPALVKRAATDPDWSLALSAVLEGDAVYYERLWATEYLPGSDVGGTTIRTTSSGGIPAALERELRFPYESGLDWASLVGAKEGNAATNAVLEGRRITTAEILHPDLTARGFEPSTVALPDISDGLGKDWKRTAGGSFGEFRLRNLLLLHLTGLPAVTGAEGWAGDRFETYGRKDGESLAVIRVAFASEQEAAEFVEAMDRWFASASARDSTEGSTTYAELPGGRAFAISQNGAQITLVASPEISAVRIAAGVLDAE